MIRMTILFSEPPSKPGDGEKITLSGKIEDSQHPVTVSIYPASSKLTHTYKTSGSGTSYISLRRGTPDAYTTVLSWIGTEDETLSHDFEYDEAQPDPEDPNKFYVVTYVNNNPNCHDTDISFIANS